MSGRETGPTGGVLSAFGDGDEPALFLGGMKQVQSLEVVPSGLQAEAKQASFFLAERAQRCEEMRWPAPVLQASERRKAGKSKQARVFETMHAAGFGGAAGLGGAGFSGLIPPSHEGPE